MKFVFIGADYELLTLLPHYIHWALEWSMELDGTWDTAPLDRKSVIVSAYEIAIG